MKDTLVTIGTGSIAIGAQSTIQANDHTGQIITAIVTISIQVIHLMRQCRSDKRSNSR